MIEDKHKHPVPCHLHCGMCDNMFISDCVEYHKKAVLEGLMYPREGRV